MSGNSYFFGTNCALAATMVGALGALNVGFSGSKTAVALGTRGTHLSVDGKVFSVLITFFFFGSFALMASTSSSVLYRLSAHPACNRGPLSRLLPDVGRSRSLSSRSIHLSCFFRISSNIGLVVLLLVPLLSTVPSVLATAAAAVTSRV